MTSQARFVCRPLPDGRGDLILGAMTKSQNGLLKPGMIYEIVDVLGELVLKEIGPAAIKAGGESLRAVGASWSNEFGHIPTLTGGRYLLTQNELDQFKI